MASKRITNKTLYQRELSRVKGLYTRYLSRGYAIEDIFPLTLPKRVTAKRLEQIKSINAKSLQDKVFNLETGESLREERNRKRRERRQSQTSSNTSTATRSLTSEMEADIIISNTYDLFKPLGKRLYQFMKDIFDDYISTYGKKAVATAIRRNEDFIYYLEKSANVYKAMEDYSNAIGNMLPDIKKEEYEQIVEEEAIADYV